MSKVVKGTNCCRMCGNLAVAISSVSFFTIDIMAPSNLMQRAAQEEVTKY